MILALEKGQLLTKDQTELQVLKKKKKKKTITLNYFFFITIFSFGGPLVVWESAASEDSESLLLRSPWAGNGRVARTISIVEGTSFSLGGS